MTGFVLSIVGGCDDYKFAFRGVTYSDPEEALKAQCAYNDDELKNIPSLTESLAKRCLVILPSHSLFQTGARGPQIVGDIIGFSPKGGDFLYQTRDQAWDFSAEVIKKRRIFKEVQVERSDKPENLPGDDYDSIIYISSNLQQWFMKIKSQTEPLPIYADESKGYSFEYTMSWLNYIEKVLIKEQLRQNSTQSIN